MDNLLNYFHFRICSKTQLSRSSGLRHLAFKVKDISKTVKELDSKGIKTEDVRTDPETGIKFTFFKDPDELPIEIREIIK